MNEKQEFELPTRWIPLRFSPELLGAIPLKDVDDAWYRCVIDEQLGLPHLLVEVVDVEDQVCRKALCGGWSLPGQADPNTSMVLSVRGIEDLPMSQVAKVTVGLAMDAPGSVVLRDGTLRDDLPAELLLHHLQSTPPSLGSSVRRPFGKGPIFDITDDERAHLFQSRTWSAEHLLALGRIVEVSASIEDRMRRLLGSALQIPQSGLGRRDYTSAAFLGVRASELTRRLKTLATMDGVPEWVPAAAEWALRAHKAIERRDALVHRAPVIIMGGSDGPKPGLGRARWTQEHETLDQQALDLLRQLVELEEEGLSVG